MQAEEILERLNAVPNMKDGYVACGPVEYEKPKEMLSSDLEDLISRLTANHVGWIARQSGVQVCAVNKPNGAEELGQVIAAELGSEAQTTQIRLIAGKWIVTTLKEGPGEKTWVYEEVRHLTVNDGTLIYRRYWDLSQDQGAVEPSLARLVAMQPLKDGV